MTGCADRESPGTRDVQTLAGMQKGAFHSRPAAKAAMHRTAPAHAAPHTSHHRPFPADHAAIRLPHLCFISVTSNWTRRQVRQPEAAPGMPKVFFKGWGHIYQLHSSGTKAHLGNNFSNTISNSAISYIHAFIIFGQLFFVQIFIAIDFVYLF